MAQDPEIRIAALERALGLDPVTGETAAERAARLAAEHDLAPLDDLLPPVQPGAGLFARIADELGLQPPLVGFHVVRRDSGTWTRLSDGVDLKLLWKSPSTGRRVYLLRLQPGAMLMAHDHPGEEECMVLEGDMQVDGHSFGPGDFQVALARSRHPHVTSRQGCICLIGIAA